MSPNYKRTSRGMLTFTTVWAGQLVSTLGTGLTSFALGVWVYQETGSATLFAINLLVWTLPNVLFAPLVGYISDRWDRRIVMILSDTGAGISSLFVFIMLLTGNLEVWHVYVATFLNSSFGSFQWPAYSAATSLLVPKKHLGRASGMTEVGQAISHLAAPALAGALFVTQGMETVLLIDVISYLVALATLLVVRFPQPEKSEEGQEGKGSFWKEAFFGWTYIKKRPGLFGILMVFAGMNFLFSLTYPMLTPMILNMAGPDVLGYVSSVAGAGMLVGTLVMSFWGGPKRRIFGIFGGELFAGTCIILLGLRPSIALIAAAGFGIMLAMPVSNGSSQAIWQTKVAQDVQGRVFAIRSMIAYSIEPIALALAGPLAEKVFEPGMAEDGKLAVLFGPLIGVGAGRGIGLMFVFAGLLHLLATAVLLLNSRIRKVEVELPDALEVESEN